MLLHTYTTLELLSTQLRCYVQLCTCIACTASKTDYAGLKQILAVDVLTGKSKEMRADSTMKNPPKIEDKSIGR